MMIKSVNVMQTNRMEMVDVTSRLFGEFQRGNAHAFSQLYDLYVDILFNYGRRLTTDHELLKDCIHDVFVKIYQKRHELGCVNNFKSYIFISLKNKICDEVRKRVYMSSTAVEELEPASSDDVEKNFLKREQEQNENASIEYLMSQLSPRQREALTLYYIEEKKYEDICQIMNMNYQSVRNLMCRGLTKLRSVAK